MSSQGLLMIVLGVWLITRTVTKDSANQSLVDRILGAGSSSSASSSTSTNAAAGYTPRTPAGAYTGRTVGNLNTHALNP